MIARSSRKGVFTPFFLAAVIAVVLTGLAYSQLTPHYRLADQVPDKEQALAALRKHIDLKRLVIVTAGDFPSSSGGR